MCTRYAYRMCVRVCGTEDKGTSVSSPIRQGILRSWNSQLCLNYEGVGREGGLIDC